MVSLLFWAELVAFDRCLHAPQGYMSRYDFDDKEGIKKFIWEEFLSQLWPHGLLTVRIFHKAGRRFLSPQTDR